MPDRRYSEREVSARLGISAYRIRRARLAGEHGLTRGTDWVFRRRRVLWTEAGLAKLLARFTGEPQPDLDTVVEETGMQPAQEHVGRVLREPQINRFLCEGLFEVEPLKRDVYVRPGPWRRGDRLVVQWESYPGGGGRWRATNRPGRS